MTRAWYPRGPAQWPAMVRRVIYRRDKISYIQHQSRYHVYQARFHDIYSGHGHVVLNPRGLRFPLNRRIVEIKG